MNQYAPTKTYNIDDDVLAVLAKMEWTQQGGQVHGIIVEQLDRALYIKTNKVIEALGGKWNRKAKAHIFDRDPRPALGMALESAEYEIIKDGYYPTPRAVGIVMAEMADILPGMDVLEPSAGTGELIKAILEVQPRCHVYAIEIDEHRRKYLEAQHYTIVDVDFFNHGILYDRIVQNPPFENNQDINHVYHAWECLRESGILVSVMSEGAFFRDDRTTLEFRQWLHGQEHEILALQPGAFQESGTGISSKIIKVVKQSVGQLRMF